MKLNPELFSQKEMMKRNDEYTIISSFNRVQLLGVHIDIRLDFDYHANRICKKAKKSYTLYLGYLNIWV